jgi:hypothetical protein
LLSGYLSAPCPPREPCVRHWRGHSTTKLPSVLDSRPSCGLSISSSARTVATVRWEVYCRVDGSRRANAWRRGRRLAAGAARSPVATENGPHEVEATSPGELYGRLHLTRTKRWAIRREGRGTAKEARSVRTLQRVRIREARIGCSAARASTHRATRTKCSPYGRKNHAVRNRRRVQNVCPTY